MGNSNCRSSKSVHIPSSISTTDKQTSPIHIIELNRTVDKKQSEQEDWNTDIHLQELPRNLAAWRVDSKLRKDTQKSEEGRLVHSASFRMASALSNTQNNFTRAPTAPMSAAENRNSLIDHYSTCEHSHSYNDLSASVQAQGELQTLKREVFVLRQELQQCKGTISKLTDRENKLQNKMSEHAQRNMCVSTKFEDLTLGDTRPTQLIRRYGNLYSEARLDAFDALDDLPEISDFDDLKGKLLFSVVVLAFRSVQTTLCRLKSQIKHLLCMPDDISQNAPAKEVEDVIHMYLTKTVDQYDLSANITEVCNQVWVTLYDYPGLKTCIGLKAYIEDCIRVSWGLSVQTPGYVIKYDSQTFDPTLFSRFHSADEDCTEIKTVLWPALLEGENGPCIHKGVVVT